MKTEHEMLKEICDLIEFDIIKSDIDGLYEPNRGFMIRHLTGYYCGKPMVIADVREIIFTKEFQDNLQDYFLLKGVKEEKTIKIRNNFMWNLGDPVNYLYNKLGLND